MIMLSFYDKAYFDFCAANDEARYTGRVYGAVKVDGCVKITCVQPTMLDTVIKSRVIASMARKEGLHLAKVAEIGTRAYLAERRDMQAQSARRAR